MTSAGGPLDRDPRLSMPLMMTIFCTIVIVDACREHGRHIVGAGAIMIVRTHSEAASRAASIHSSALSKTSCLRKRRLYVGVGKSDTDVLGRADPDREAAGIKSCGRDVPALIHLHRCA
jgi:hypothetical protein